MFVKEVRGSIIKNSRGERTIQMVLQTFNGLFEASAPSGKSKGKNEVPDYNRKGIDRSLVLLNGFCRKLRGKNFLIRKFDDLVLVESEIRKFEQVHGYLGANVTYVLETVFLRAAAKEKKKELWEFVKGDGRRPKLPIPIGNVVGGGMHSTLTKGKEPDIQEFLFVPKEKKFSRQVSQNIRAYFRTKGALKKEMRVWSLKRDDENAWQTSLNNEDVLEVLKGVAKEKKVMIGLDVAASTFCSDTGYYKYKNKELMRDKKEQIDYMRALIERYGLAYVEDPLQEEDFSGFAELMAVVKKKIKDREVLIVGDDLTVTSLPRIRRAVNIGAINAVVIKPNQNGSLLQVKKVVEFCRAHDLKMIFSHRSGETMDTALADYAVGFEADYIKTGVFGRERLIKLRRIMDINAGF